MIVNNNNQFNGQTNFTQVNITINVFPTPAQSPEALQAPKKKINWLKVLSIIYSMVSAIIKFLPLFLPLTTI